MRERVRESICYKSFLVPNTPEVKSIIPQANPSEVTPLTEQSQKALKIEYVLDGGMVEKVLTTCKCRKIVLTLEDRENNFI